LARIRRNNAIRDDRLLPLASGQPHSKSASARNPTVQGFGGPREEEESQLNQAESCVAKRDWGTVVGAGYRDYEYPKTNGEKEVSTVGRLRTGESEAFTEKGDYVTFDIIVLAAGSNAFLPGRTPGHDAKGGVVH